MANKSMVALYKMAKVVILGGTNKKLTVGL